MNPMSKSKPRTSRAITLEQNPGHAAPAPTVALPMMLSRQAVQAHLQISRAKLYRMIQHKQFPAPDFYIGVLPRWLPATVSDWATAQAAR
jgi:predicted DNA-binding transcriptional regulator AlpA